MRVVSTMTINHLPPISIAKWKTKFKMFLLVSGFINKNNQFSKKKNQKFKDKSSFFLKILNQ